MMLVCRMCYRDITLDLRPYRIAYADVHADCLSLERAAKRHLCPCPYRRVRSKQGNAG